MFKKLLCTATLLVGSAIGAQAAPVLSITPSSSNVNLGSTFTLDILITGVTDLYGWELDLGFSPAGRLNASAATEGNFLGAGTTFGGGTVNNAAGTITTMFDALSGPTGVSGDGILAHVSFQAMTVGIATISLSRVLLMDSNLDTIFFNFPGDALSATVNISRIVTGVPEPTTLALMALALAGLSLTRRRA